MNLSSYKFRGGLHPETATVTNALAAQGVVAPHTGKPFSEAMILGIAGGLGAGYILWEFKRWNATIPVFGFQNNWQYPVKFLTALGERLAVSIEIQESGGAKKAAGLLRAALDEGQPAICWVDQGHLPYLHLPEGHHGCFGHLITVVGIDEEADRVRVDDRGKKPFAVTEAELALARGRIPSYKNRLMTVQRGDKPNLEKAVRAGLADCAAHLAKPSDSFSLPVFRKWARMMTDPKHKKGWPQVFAQPVGLFATLKSIYEAVEPGAGSGGGNLRKLYADFLKEAGEVTGNGDLAEVATLYRRLAKQWSAFAQAALAEDNEPLARTRGLIDRRRELIRKKGGDAAPELAEIGAQLNRDYTRYNQKFPGGKRATVALFADLKERMEKIHAAEVEANRALSGAL